MPTRETTFRFLAILVPIAFFVILEGVLRVVNYGGEQALFREITVNGQQCYAVNPEVTRRYFRTFQVRAMVSNDFFARNKGANTWRVFCLGESSTLGYPYFFNGTFPSMFKERLETLWPEKHIEVVNLGITAVSSYTVLDFVKDLEPYQPDAILVYCGHNEFYGALGTGSVESLGQQRWAIKAYLALQEWRTFRLIRDGFLRIRSLVGPLPEQSRDATVMEGMAKNREIGLDSKEYGAAVSNFRANLEEMVQVAARNNVPIVLSTLVSNLNGIEPFASLFAAGTGGKERARWEMLYAEGKKALEEKRVEEALRHLTEAVAIDSMPARLHFALGRVYEQIARWGEANERYRRARDLDALRFRAPTAFNEVIREVARQYGTPLADAEQLIESESDHKIIGNRYLLEHVHLSVEGYFLLAKAFAEAVSTHGILAPKDEWQLRRDLTDDEYRSKLALTPFDSVAAAIRLYVLMNSWPFRDGGISARQFEARTDIERLAKSYLLKEITWEEAHVRLGEQFEARGDFKNASLEYRALAKATPTNVSPFLRWGKAMLASGEFTEAKGVFQKTLSFQQNYHAHHYLGFIAMREGSFEEAVGHFRAALGLQTGIAESDLAQTWYFLAAGLAAQGEYAEAQSTVKGLLAKYPDYRDAQQLSDRLAVTLGQSSGRR